MSHLRTAEDLIVYEKRIFRFKAPVQINEEQPWDPSLYGSYRMRKVLAVDRECDVFEHYAFTAEGLAKLAITLAAPTTCINIFTGDPQVFGVARKNIVIVGYALPQGVHQEFNQFYDSFKAAMGRNLSATSQ